MKNYAAIGTCRICGEGRLIVAREDASGVLYVLCEECEFEWKSPEQAQDIESATRDVFGRSTLLAREELADHEWRTFLW